MVQTLPGLSGVSISNLAGPGSSRSSAFGETSEVWDPMTIWSWAPTAASRDWDLAVVIAHGSSIGPGS
jgi:hypothetical protein